MRIIAQECGFCGGPATGLASIDMGGGQVRYCHGDEDAEPTCYERAQWAKSDGNELLLTVAAESCHCGAPVTYGYDGDPTRTRGMCETCDSVRCDAYPGACK